MSETLNNYCVIDALCGISTSSPQTSRFTDSFDSIKFLLGKNFDDYTMMIITDIDGHVEIVSTDGSNLTKETDETTGETFLMWTLGRNITAESGVVIYQIAGFKTGDDGIESVWYSKEGRLMVTDSIDSTSYSAAVMGAYPNLLTKLLVQSDEIKNLVTALEKSKVDTVDGMGLSENNYSDAEKEKLASVENGAKANVQPDWDESDEASDGFIKNKPDFKKIATSGSYDDLENTPIVDLEFDSESTNAQSGTAVAQAMAKLVDSAPETLNTLDELAAALGDDPNFATTIMTLLGSKANESDLAKVATSGSYADLSGTPEIPSIAGLATEDYVNKKISDVNTQIDNLSDASIQNANAIDVAQDDINTLKLNVEDNRMEISQNGVALSDLNLEIDNLKSQLGDIEAATGSILAQQESIIAMQNSLINGGESK